MVRIIKHGLLTGAEPDAEELITSTCVKYPIDSIMFPNDEDVAYTHYFVFIKNGRTVLYLGNEATFTRDVASWSGEVS